MDIWLKNHCLRTLPFIQEDFAPPSYLQENINSLNDISTLTPNSCVSESVKQLTCSYCGKLCSNKPHFQRHTRVHTGERPFVCHICNATFNYKGNLNVHLKMHTGDKPFKCTKCSYTTNIKANLKRHMKNIHVKV